MYLLGVSAFYHDSAACLLKDGRIIAAAEEERFSRLKHDPSFPEKSIRYCLDAANITGSDITTVAFYEKPFLKFERLLETYLAFAPAGFKSFLTSMPLWLREKVFQKKIIINNLSSVLGDEVDWSDRLVFSEHHLSHAASAFFPSPFDTAAVLTMDGVGEWTTTSIAIGTGSHLKIEQEIKFPHSIGLLYSAFTYYSGFKVNSGEYKLMGLAPYGEPRYADMIKKHLINIADDGSFQLDMDYFEFASGLKMVSKKFEQLFGGPARRPETEISQKDMDLAASIQKVTEELVIKIARYVAELTGESKLCMSGGVALNCVANGALWREQIFEEIWVQPAAGDSGGAIGAAFVAWHLHHGNHRRTSPGKDSMQGAFIGPEFSDRQIIEQLDSHNAVFEQLTTTDLISEVSQALADNKAVGWMQGRMEFGPRALGARSILANPLSSTMQRQLNLKVKFRESFRPFAPSVLVEDVDDWFTHDIRSPYMLFVTEVKADHRLDLAEVNAQIGLDSLKLKRSTVPAVTHVDYSARVQTVESDTNPKFHRLISAFKDLTGCPMVVNTSFNVRGEPIVCTPEDAYLCFMNTNLDILVVENFILRKIEQGENKSLPTVTFEPD